MTGYSKKIDWISRKFFVICALLVFMCIMIFLVRSNPEAVSPYLDIVKIITIAYLLVNSGQKAALELVDKLKSKE